jgi:Domain of unknown function (DUF4956)
MENALKHIISSIEQNIILEFGVRYALNLIVTFVLIRTFYYARHKNKDFVFTFFLFNSVLFLICFLLSSTKIELGFSFGLFAIFSIFRYRTVTVPVREMGYFFLTVTVGIINALANLSDTLLLLMVCNVIILVLTYILDGNLGLEHESFEEINYDRMDLIQPEKRLEMLQNLRERTGLMIHRVKFQKIDFAKNVVNLHAYYYTQENESTDKDSPDNDD